MQEGNSPFDMNQFKTGNINPKLIKWGALVVVIIIVLWTSIFQVGAEQVGVILRFGNYTRTVEPGLNFKMPFGIETVQKVPVQRQLKEEFGFRTQKPGVRTQYSKDQFKSESLMLTGDLNAAEVEWIVQYRIYDPYKFLFKVRNAVSTFRDMNEAVMREIIGDRSVNEALTVGRVEIGDTVKQKLQDLADQYETGIRVDQVVLQDVTPPDPVKPAFNEVNEAQQEKEKLINQARSEYNKVIPKARGQAQQTIEEARGYAVERVNNAKGEANRFTALYEEYRKAPTVTKKRLYLEAMNEVLPKVGRKLITDEEATGILPLFNLEKEVMKNAK
jgi:membrane protease subunit HflK